MANQKVSQLTAAAALTGAEQAYVVQSSASRRTTTQDIANLAPGTDLTYTASSRLLASSTGADVTLPVATTSLAGLLSAADKTKLDGLSTFDPASPGAIGGTVAAAGSFTTLSASSRLNVPNSAAGSPAARDLYAVADSIRYRDSGNVERLLLNAADNLANLASAATARTNLGLGTLATQSGTFSGSSSGTNTGDQTITLTGDVTGSGTGSFAATLASTAVTPGSYGSASQVAGFTVDAKGRLTVASNTSISIASTAISDSTAAGRALLAGADASAQRSSLGLGSAATSASTAFAASGLATASGLTMSTARLLGRSTASTGAVEEISVGTGLSLSGGALAFAEAAMPLTFTAGTITYGATTDLDMAALAGGYRTISLTGNITFTTSNRASGRTVTLRLICDATQRTLTFPAGWVFVGSKPSNIAASKTAVLSLTFFGTADTDCVAAFGVQA